MIRPLWWLPPLVLLAGAFFPLSPVARGQQEAATAPPASSEEIAFFENKVRPVLAENCLSCHSGSQALAGLRLDDLSGLRGSGSKVAVVVPGKPEESRLIRAIRHDTGIAAMPPSGKLKPEQIAALTEWVRRGAVLPRVSPAAPKADSGFPLKERRQHWAYRPVQRPAIPKVQAASWVTNPVDAFLLAELEAQGLAPAPAADRRTLLRRVTFDLTGLPPTPAEMASFLADKSPDAYTKVVERLLASPAYGERWARHWLDLVRYGESLGHEFDFTIFNAYQYRDYVIRAFNADVPYNRMVQEHFAGDLLPDPRRNPKTGINESILGTGFFWLGEGKHSPVDIRQEQADRIDNMIDVVGKTFLAQTLACSRCHDHKFDPIPARDYYALYGILKSSRYQQAHVDAPETFAAPMQKMQAVHRSLNRAVLAGVWQANVASLPDDKVLAAANPKAPQGKPGKPIAPLATWRATGQAFAVPGKPGDLLLTGDPKKPALMLLARPTATSAALSRRLEGALRSPTFTIDSDFLHLRLAGQGSRIHIVVDNFLLIRDPICGPLFQSVNDPKVQWRTVDLRMWKGREAYIELSDSPVPNLAGIDAQELPAEAGKPNDHWLMLTDAVLSNDRQPPAQTMGLASQSASEVRAALRTALERWGQGQVTSADTAALETLNTLLRDGLLDVSPLSDTAARLAAIEATVPAPTRALAMCDGTGRDESVFVRGSHKTLGERTPRLQIATCFTETKPLVPKGSGRLEFANMIVSPQHPLTARVMVNRIWKHHFGVGIVPTVDDFGWMGEKPSHPELLDWLASEFVRQGWSIKQMHRLIVHSAAYRMRSTASDPKAETKDPKNTLLHRANVRRLEAEAIRDSILTVSGRLDRTLYGPSVYSYVPERDGRGAPPQGPLDGNGRRTIYLSVRRNFLSPFLLAFDFPTPFTTIGRRTVSNVPAQALALMNGEFVRQQAQVWAERSLKDSPQFTPSQRVNTLYLQAFGRYPTDAERSALIGYLGNRNDATAWADICHALFNVKEFVYVR
ncbi:MAG: PSD1 and planctomycete cytochrome C domain-containing protein [Armatimonadaceae bacterium]